MKRRRFLAVGAGLAGGVGLPVTVSGCGSESGGGQVTLRLVAAEHGGVSGAGSTQRYWNDVVTAFTNRHPGIEVDIQMIRYQDANAELTRMANSGQAPDIAHISAFADFAESGALYRADELLSLPVLADFVPSIAVAGERQRVQYGMPLSASVTRLFYNRELFEDAGLDPDSPPADWDALRQAATALRDSGVPTPFGLPLGHDDAHAEAVTWMLSGGGALTDSTGGYTIDSMNNVETFVWLRDELVEPGLTGTGAPARTRREDVYQGFAEGTVAMLTADTLLMSQAELAGVQYGTAPVPGVDGPASSTLGQATWLVAFGDRGNREQAATFLDFVFTTDAVSGFAARNDLLPVTTPASQAMMDSDNSQDQRIIPFLEALPAASFYPVGKISWATVAAALAGGIGAAVQPDSNVLDILGRLQAGAERADAGA